MSASVSNSPHEQDGSHINIQFTVVSETRKSVESDTEATALIIAKQLPSASSRVFVGPMPKQETENYELSSNQSSTASEEEVFSYCNICNSDKVGWRTSGRTICAREMLRISISRATCQVLSCHAT
jgi:hypothetical protein